MSYTTSLGFTPVFSVTKGGEDVTSNFSDRMLSIKIESKDGGGDADTVDIVLDDRDWKIATPSIGEGSATLVVSMGYAETGMYEMGSFQVDDLYYEWTPKTMRLHGNSLGFSTNAKAPIITAYNGQTLGDIVGAIATAAGVQPKVDPTLAAVQIPYLHQQASSMHLLQELERKFGGLAKFQDGYLSFTKRGTGDNSSGTSVGNFQLGPEDIIGGSINPSNYYAYSKVRASYRDKTSNQMVWLQSTTAGSPNSTVPFLLKTPYNSQTEAQAAADSTMAQLNRKSKRGTITLSKGDASIRAGQGFTISGCRDGIDDDSYTVQRVVHVLAKESGITTTIDLFSEGGNVDFSQQADSETQTDFNSSPDSSSTGGSGGIGAM